MNDDISGLSLSLPTWLQAILLTLVAGGGFAGIAAVVKAIIDRRQGVSAHELAEDEAISQRWQSIIDVQVKALIDPLKKEVADLRAEIASLKSDLVATRGKYWKAISHIRLLHLWISRHIPEGTEPPPATPDEIMEDV